MIRIKELKLKNFRGFHQKDEEGEDTEIEIIFPDSNLIVFIGENGSGKTSILDAIGILLNNMIGYITDPFDIWGDDSKIDKKLETKINEFYNQKHFEENNLNIFESDINNHDEKSFDGTEIQLKIEKTDLRTEVRVQSDWNLSGIFKGKQYFREANFDQLKNLKKLYEDILRSTNKENQRADIFVYYNISRLQAEDNKKESKKYPFDQYITYQNSFNKDNKFSYFYQWFSELYTYENNIVSRKDVNFRHPELEPIRIALEEFFSKKNLNYDLSDFRIDYDKRNKPLLFATKNQTEHLSVNQLSDGERTLLLLVADIARRLTIANKEIIQDNIENAHLILNGTGIVIIDEIDLHLHPKWQRLVVPALMNTFPKIQFIVTTHSDLVITHVPTETIIQLGENPPKFLKDKYNYIFYGADVENAREFAMSLKEKYPKDVADKLLALFESIKNDKEVEYKKIREELLSIIDKDHPELIRAKNMMELKRMMKK